MNNLTNDFAALDWRMRSLNPRNVIFILDVDLTLATKSEKDFHFISINDAQHATIAHAYESCAGFNLLTARGEASSLTGIFGRHGTIPLTLALASNSGHWILRDATKPETARITIPLNDPEAEEHFMTTMHGMVSVIRALRAEYESLYGGSIQHDEDLAILNMGGEGRVFFEERQICGAIIYEGIIAEQRDALNSRLKQAFGTLPTYVNDRIFVSSKNIPMGDFHAGYHDIKPAGMDKGFTAVAILEHPELARHYPDDAHVIMAGDSSADLAMFEAVTNKLGADRVTNIWVGNDPSANEFAKRTGVQIWHLEGDQYQSISKMYNIIGSAAVQSGNTRRIHHTPESLYPNFSSLPQRAAMIG